MIGSERATSRRPLSLAGALAHAKIWLADTSDNRIAQLAAGQVFMLRVASAFLAFVSQVLLARWMGSYEYGIFIYVWTWVVMIGPLSELGLSSAARRFIPEYTELKSFDRLRGFLTGSCWLAFGTASAIGALGALSVFLLTPWLNHFTVTPLYLACLTVPVFGLMHVQAGIAHAYDWQRLALMPFYIWRQLALTLLMGAAYLIGFPTHAVVAMVVVVASTWVVTIGQLLFLNRRLRTKVREGKRRYEPRVWLATSMPIFMVETCYLSLTYVDVLTLEHFVSPHQVAVYYAAARILALVAFVYFAIVAATTHKFTEYHVRGDRKRLASFFAQTARWTFWPSLAACVLILGLGYPLLSLFGAEFTDGYPVMFILAIGMLARASIGPAERLLNMLGERKQCAGIYAVAFVINLGLCVVLIPRMGIEGAAVATSTALIVESILLYIVTKWRFGIHAFVFGNGRA